MTPFIDTNIVVRHLTGDPPDMADRSTAFLAQADELRLTDLVAAETIHVLESFYEAPRPQVAEALRSLLAFDSIVCVDPALLLRAVEVYEIDPETTGINEIASFDRSIDRVTTIHRIEPGSVGLWETEISYPDRVGSSRKP